MTQEALKLALEALEETWYHVGTFQPTEKAIDLYDEARTAIKEALAQPEQEPVAFICEFYADEGHPFVSFEPVTHGTNTPLYTTPPAQRQLESTTDMMMGLVDRLGQLPDDIDPRAWEHLLVYAPQRRPLTELQITEIYTKWESTKGTSWADLIRAIEAAHNIF